MSIKYSIITTITGYVPAYDFYELLVVCKKEVQIGYAPPIDHVGLIPVKS